VKREVFAALDKVVREDAILATNTSSLSVTELSVATQRPSRVVGMHFFNPAAGPGVRRGDQTVVTEPGVVEDVSRLAATSQGPGGCGRPAPASSPMRCCSAI